MTIKRQQGIALIEAVIAVSIISLVFVGSLTTLNLYVNSWTKNLASIKSSYLLAEGAEAVYLLRDGSWSNISSLNPNTKYYFVWNGSAWVTSTTPVQVDGVYDRYVIFEPVYRDASDNIAESGTADDRSKLATVYVGYLNNNATTTASVRLYVFDLYES